MKAMSMVFCALFVIGALGATPSAFALDGRAEVSNAFAYLLSTLADVESVLSENVEISNSILSVEGAKGGFVPRKRTIGYLTMQKIDRGDQAIFCRS